MKLFGEKCVRCGVRTDDDYYGKPTCEVCRAELELVLTAAAEAKRLCPADGTTLAKEIVHGIIIDRCPNCGGVWFDRGEMERMNEEVADEVWRATIYGRSARMS